MNILTSHIPGNDTLEILAILISLVLLRYKAWNLLLKLSKILHKYNTCNIIDYINRLLKVCLQIEYKIIRAINPVRETGIIDLTPMQKDLFRTDFRLSPGL
jgi:hypothetical protein